MAQILKVNCRVQTDLYQYERKNKEVQRTNFFFFFWFEREKSTENEEQKYVSANTIKSAFLCQ